MILLICSKPQLYKKTKQVDILRLDGCYRGEQKENALKINTSVVLCNKKTKTLLPSWVKYLILDTTEAFLVLIVVRSIKRKSVLLINTKDKQRCI